MSTATAIAVGSGSVFVIPADALEEAEKRGEPYDLSALRVVGSSGVMWTQPVKDRLLAFAKASGANLVLNDARRDHPHSNHRATQPLRRRQRRPGGQRPDRGRAERHAAPDRRTRDDHRHR